MIGNLENDPSYLYTAIPWKTPTIDFAYWLWIVLNLTILNLMWSLLLVFPSVITYIIEGCVRLLTLRLNSAKSITEFRSLVKTYQRITHCTRDGVTDPLANTTLIFYIVAGIQQFFEMYCMFQLIKTGGDWDDYQLILLDVFVSFLTQFLVWNRNSFLNKYFGLFYYSARRVDCITLIMPYQDWLLQAISFCRRSNVQM